MRLTTNRAAAFAALALSLFLIGGCGPGPAAAPDRAAPGAAAPGPTLTVPEGSSTQSLQVGGVPRTFRMYRPATLPDPAPLVVMLHGGFGSGQQAENAYGWDQLADAEGFLVAYPDGQDRAWNTLGGCCGRPARDGVDDVAFISELVAAVGRAVPVDTDRVYATGISNGGIMSYTLACRTTLFAAIGPDAATQLGDCPSPAPTSVIHLHGTADRMIPYGGGKGAGVARIDGPSAPALHVTWRGIDRCGPPVVTTAGPVTTSLAGCPDGRAVELVTVEGAGHQWPGAASKPAAERLLHTDPPSTALDATEVIWRFFQAHPRTG